MVAREASTGQLWFYPGSGTGTATSRRAVGAGWGMHDAVLTAADRTGDRRADLYAREGATGNLWLYAGDGTGGFPSRRVVSSGWQMHDRLVAPGDVTRDGQDDLYGRERVTGNLWLYPGDTKGGFPSRRMVGTGWQMHDLLVAAGDVNRDGRNDLYGREKATGTLWLYTGDGAGGFSGRRAVGSGWQMHNTLLGTPDVTGDGRPDLYGREKATGALWLYTGDGAGGFSGRRVVGTGWQMHDALL